MFRFADRHREGGASTKLGTFGTIQGTFGTIQGTFGTVQVREQRTEIRAATTAGGKGFVTWSGIYPRKNAPFDIMSP
jgi:hypothetical protein